MIRSLERHSLVVWAFWLTLALVALRLALTLTHEGYLGVDGGAYMLHAKRLLGLDLPQIDFTRPILGPGWILVPFLLVWGDDIGYKVWDAVFSVIPFLPCAALFASRILSKKQAIVAMIFLCLNPWHWEMVITGALPLIGIGLIFLCLWGLIPIISGHGRFWDKSAVIFSIALIPYINQTCTGLAAVALPVFVLGYCWFTESWVPIKRVAPYMAAGALLAVPAIVLFYGDVFVNSSRVSFPGPKIFIPNGIHHGYMVAAYGITAAFTCLKKGPTPAFRALALVMLVHSILPIFYSYDEAIINIFFRSQHLVTPLIIILGVWYVAHATTTASRRAMTVCASVFAVMLVCASGFVFIRQAEYSDMVTPDVDAARALLPDAQEEYILTNSFMGGLWLSALEGTPTYWLFSAEPPVLWQPLYPHMQCLVGWIPECDPQESARFLNVKWVLVDTRFPKISRLGLFVLVQEPNLWGAPDDTWAPTYAAPWLRLIFQQGTVRLWEIDANA